ncbi:MAG: prolyl oligopeptidase family serine peptidase [Bacteroidales bacterium]|nr:prolyl oligopeptidase family serine peptidase [Bacteroidales bacterium]
MKKKLPVFVKILLIIGSLNAQRVPLNHTVYDTWKSIGSVIMSQDGRFSITVVNAQASDGYLLQSNLLNGSSFVIDRGRTPAITFDSRFAVCAIAPFFEQTRQARIERRSREEMPKDTLAIWALGRSELIKYPYLYSFKMAEEGSLAVAFKTTPPADTSDGARPPRREPEEGRDLMLHYFATGQVDTLRFVSEFAFTRNGTELFFVRRLNSNDTGNTLDGLYLYDLITRTERAVLTGPRGSRFFLPTSDKNERFFAFYANTDISTGSENSINIYFFERGDNRAIRVVDANIAGLPLNYIISENRTLSINKEGTRLFFGIAPRPLEKDTNLVDFETARLDIWHYRDDFVQPEQLVNLQRSLRRSYLSYVNIRSPQSGLVRLATPQRPNVSVPNHWSSDWAFSVSNVPYRIQRQWNADTPDDLYIIDVATGEPRRLITAGTLTGTHASPEGRFLVWFDRTARHWFSYEVATETMHNLTEGIGVAFWDEVHDRPQLPPPYGSGGWRENDAVIFLSDRYDIWEVDPSGRNAPFMLTDGIGRLNRYSFCILHLSKDATITSWRGRWWSPTTADPIRDGETIHFTAFDNVNKYNGFFLKEQGRRRTPMQRLVLDGHNYQHLRWSNDGRIYTFVRSNFSESPNLWITRNRFRTQTRLSDINPQQENYLWGTAQLVSWACPNGRPHDGILFKPENFDPAKKYPMIVFFYERRSYQLFHHREPAPSRSTINISYFVSNGYLVFLPDIYYDLGFPGQSAYNSIMSGVDMLIENPWVDQDNIGIQGQSWAGYKIAWIITRTDRFRAAMAGAPVSNMTSAYGTIRWATGLVRQFQYEGTQSRIGQNLWDALDLYIENSPLFFLPNVNTPLLIMHNDGDGAVPWEEGIQLFTGLRRLGKPVWLLNYNGEAHNLRERRNQKDLSIRLSQFFNHFLKGEPAPVWIERGVPATRKGIDWGLDFEHID